ncbi:hypothetical protein YC2023_044277 [Brassica napus]
MVKEQVDLLTQKEASKMVKRSTSSYDVETDKLDLISKYDDTVLTDASLTNTPRETTSQKLNLHFHKTLVK